MIYKIFYVFYIYAEKLGVEVTEERIRDFFANVDSNNDGSMYVTSSSAVWFAYVALCISLYLIQIYIIVIYCECID